MWVCKLHISASNLPAAQAPRETTKQLDAAGESNREEGDDGKWSETRQWHTYPDERCARRCAACSVERGRSPVPLLGLGPDDHFGVVLLSGRPRSPALPCSARNALARQDGGRESDEAVTADGRRGAQIRCSQSLSELPLAWRSAGCKSSAVQRQVTTSRTSEGWPGEPGSEMAIGSVDGSVKRKIRADQTPESRATPKIWEAVWGNQLMTAGHQGAWAWRQKGRTRAGGRGRRIVGMERRSRGFGAARVTCPLRFCLVDGRFSLVTEFQRRRRARPNPQLAVADKHVKHLY